MDIREAKLLFLQYLAIEKRSSRHTLTAYSSDLEEFEKFLLDTYSLHDDAAVDHLVVRSWVIQLMENNISARSVNRKITTLKTFYRFLQREFGEIQNPMEKVLSPKTSKRLPVFVEESGMELLLDKVDFGDGFAGLRDRLIIDMLYGTGMRLSELIELQLSDIDLFRRQLKVLGKRNKERIIPIHTELGTWIEKYLAARPESAVFTFFVTDKGGKLYEKFVYRLVNSYLSQVTTISKKSPHVLRHTFATHLLNNGADLNAIKELLGHANLSATQVYTHTTIEKLKNIHKQAHPRANQ